MGAIGGIRAPNGKSLQKNGTELIAHLTPVTITVKAVGTFPQAYPCIPRKDLQEERSAELGYLAMQSLTTEYIINKLEVASRYGVSAVKSNDISKEETDQLEIEEWYVVSHTDALPTVMDIEMAIERLLAKRYVDENSYALIQYGATQKKQPVLHISAPEYIIDMGYAIIGLVTHYSTSVINYGPWDVELRMRNFGKKDVLRKSDIVVQWKKQTKLGVGDCAPLHVSWHPSRERYTERSTHVEHTIYLEVVHGCTIPIVIKGVVTYPYLTVNTKLLDFQDVIVGECLTMCILVKNEGLVSCFWEAKLSNGRKKQEEGPFYLHYNSDVCPVGSSEIIRISFKPRKMCYAERKLNVIVKMGLESQTITLTGRGIERRLNIIEPAVNFLPVVPFTETREAIFAVQNTCEYPVEFFWHHLDSSILHDDRIARALLYYYRTDEILLPRRKPGDATSPILIEFYNSLLNEMAHALAAEKSKEARPSEIEDPAETKENKDEARKKRSRSSVKRRRFKRSSVRQRSTTFRGSSMRETRNDDLSDSSGSDYVKKNCPPMSIFGDDSGDAPALYTTDPEEIQKLLHCYIDKLRKTPDFYKRMRDPVKEIFEKIENPTPSNLDPTKPKKKVCVIFHGAPFTEYQETACKSAKVLGVPILSIDKVIIEVMALSESSCSDKLRQIVDDAYQNYFTIFQKHKDLFDESSKNDKEIDSEGTKQQLDETQGKLNEAKLSGKGKSSQSGSSPRVSKETRTRLGRAKLSGKGKSSKGGVSPRILKEDTRTKSAYSETFDEQDEAIPRLHQDPDPLKEFKKIPDLENLETLDPLSRYEYKVRAVLYMRKILSPYTIVDSTRDKARSKSTERSGRKKQEDTFLPIDAELLEEALEERLSMEDFERGFVAQSLRSAYLHNNAMEILLMLLRIVGHVEYSLFVTFLNSTANYNRKVDELRASANEKRTSERMKRIQDIDEMSSSEYDLLTEEDKKMYLAAILPTRKEEALRRRLQFTQRLSELRAKKVRGHASTSKNSKPKRTAKRARAKVAKMSNREKKSANSKAASSKKGTRSNVTRSRDSSKHGKEKISKDVQEVVTAMDQYYSELSAIETIIRNWDPIRKVVEAPSLGRNKIPRTAKSRDRGSLDTTREVSVKRFHTWYVRPSDPWGKTMYNIIVTQMNENSLAKAALPSDVAPQPDLRPKIYSIFAPRNLETSSTQIHDDVYQLVSISPIPDSTPVADESIRVADVDTEDHHMENKGNREKRRLKRSNKIGDQKSIYASTVESRDTYNGTLEAFSEGPLKPRWILRPNEVQKFKIRFQPEETGVYEHTYALSIANGANATYKVNVKGVAAIPRLDMNPEAIFPKIKKTKIDDTNSPTYFLDNGTFDFGSMLILRKDKRPHRREAEFKFRNISEVNAEVYFYMTENNPGCFSYQPDKLFIAPRECGSLNLSAIATKIGPLSERLYLCIKNNPKVEIIELRSNGSKLDVELGEKQFTFNRTLLYRREVHVVNIRNKSPIPFFWSVEVEEPAEPQITLAPSKGIIKPWGEQQIEFCYYGTKIGVVAKNTMLFKVFLNEEDEDPISTDTITMSGETYDVAVDVDHANPIDLRSVKVGFPAHASFTIKNRGAYEVKYVIMLEDDEKLERMVSGNIKFKETLDIRPAAGSIEPNKIANVQVTVVPKSEVTLKNAQLLKCHLIDTHKETIVVAEIPLTISLTAYYTRFRLHPYPLIDFGAFAICTEKTIYLNIENTGNFPLHYSIYVPPDRHPSLIYMSHVKPENLIKNKVGAGGRKEKRSARTEKKTAKIGTDSEALTIGPMTITKTDGSVDVGQTDSIAINCYPEFIGTQEEQITILVPDSIPQDRNGKTITLSVNSCMPAIDFQNLDAMFEENHLVDRIQDFNCPQEIGAHTVFARQERCLYFRYVSVLNTHVAYLKLHNRNIIPADVEVLLVPESLTPKTAKTDTFIVDPQRERIPAMSHKTFTISFAPTVIEIYKGILEVILHLPPHLADENFVIKLTGESCVPEVMIVDPVHGKRERAVLNFGRTLVNEASVKNFAIENVGPIEAKVIVEISEDLDFLFTFAVCSDTRHLLHVWENDCDDQHDRCTVIRMMPGNVARFKATFCPNEIGRHEGKIRLFIVDNPYENLTINLEGEAYVESIVLNGLDLVDNDRKVSNGRRESNQRSRKVSSKQNSLVSAYTARMPTVSLIYDLDYGTCFVKKMYKRTFRIANKSTDRWFRFQWSVHPDVVFVPSIGHLRNLTCKEIIATFLTSEPTNHVNTRVECAICEIEITDPSNATDWDDRQTKVRWEEMDSDIANYQTDAETLTRKVVEPTIEPAYEAVPGTTKCIQVLLNATVAFSEYSCPVQEIHFKDTLMFQTREYAFALSNPGVVNTTYAWKINMDEQYPRRTENASNIASARISDENLQSRSNSRSSKGIFTSSSETRRGVSGSDEKSGGDSKNLLSQRFGPIPTHGTLEIKPSSSSCKHSDLFSSTAGLTERSTDSWLEGDDLPFTICPSEGSLLPGQSIQCTLKFSPMDIFYYRAYLTCRVENLNPDLPQLVIPIVARSLLPYCHFDVQESDYITTGRRDPKLPGPAGYEIEDSTLWENIRVIEFRVVGVGETHVKKFHLINPTADDYHFSWKNRTVSSGNVVSAFHCAVPEGIAERGKRTDLAFTFLAEDIGVFESFWLFSIERYNLESLFLFVGVVTEPSVCCLTVHLKLKPTVLGIPVQDSIRILNTENFQIPFNVLEESLHSEGKFQSLKVTPMNGILPSKMEQCLRVEYHPTRVGEFHFSVQCAVKLMKKPITVYVTTSVYDIVSSVFYTDMEGQNIRVQEDKQEVIDFGKLMLKESRTVKLELVNSGRVAFYYAWDLGMTPEIQSRNAYSVTMLQNHGHVTSESKSSCDLTLAAFKKTTIKDHPVTLKVSRGPTYRFLLKACAKRPAVEFSFDRYDFGPCYVQENNALAYCTELRVTNSESTQFIIECKYEDKPHMSVDLSGTLEALAANSSITIPIVFRPLKEEKYSERLYFTINSTMEKRVAITGEGITYKVRLANPRDKSIDLGNVPVNKTATRKVSVVNEGRAPIELRFGIMQRLAGYDEYRDRTRPHPKESRVTEDDDEQADASILETKRSWTCDVTLQTGEPDLAEVLNIEPSTEVLLRPDKRINVVVKFKSTCRMRPFLGKVALQTASTILPLFVVRGSCVGPEFRLNRTYLPLGVVVQGCVSEAGITLSNTGDLGARFKWNTSKLPPDFSIAPTSGYCSPGMDVNFVVKFQPVREHNLIQGEVSIEIEKYGSLAVKITGGCCKLPEPTETLFFASNVREKQTQSVIITNNTNSHWKLKPEVTGDYFTSQEVVHVPAKESASCSVTYAPIVTNTENNPHKGTLLFKLPEEIVPVLYSLHGSSLPPRVLAKIERQFPAKTKYTESLPVYNWLDRQQRFECKIELLRGNKAQSKAAPLFKFVGNGKIDVPPNRQRDYQVVFYSYEESNFHFKVTFINQENEYQFYEIVYDVTKPEVIESIKLTTIVRFPIYYTLKFENPLQEQSITYTVQCPHPYIAIDETTKTVPALTQDHINVRYYPILPSNETVATLNINCTELGDFPYELRLTAIPAPPEKVTRVTAILGSNTTFSLPISNCTKQNAEFTIKVDNDCFTSEKTVTVAGLKNTVIDVTYEPSDIENVTASLIVSSSIAGEFIFPIIGTYSLPKPLGPYTISQRAPASIPFRNVFKEQKTFEFILDVPEIFATLTPSATVRQKRDFNIRVSLRDQDQGDELIGDKFPVTGKLVVYCKDPRLSHINWIYYLRGVFE